MFTRTACACTECVACCKSQPGPLAPGDLERIGQYLGQTITEAKANFWASPGAVVMNTRTMTQRRIGTITPRYDKRKGRCVFLDDQDRCSIHPVAPAGCSLFDPHMSAVEGAIRGNWLAREQQNPDYQALRRTLPLADHYKPRRV